MVDFHGKLVGKHTLRPIEIYVFLVSPLKKALEGIRHLYHLNPPGSEIWAPKFHPPKTIRLWGWSGWCPPKTEGSDGQSKGSSDPSHRHRRGVASFQRIWMYQYTWDVEHQSTPRPPKNCIGKHRGKWKQKNPWHRVGSMILLMDKIRLTSWGW